MLLQNIWIGTVHRFLHRRRHLLMLQQQQPMARMMIPSVSAALSPESSTTAASAAFELLFPSIWNMAVPKKRTSHSKKRLRTTLQKRIKIRNDIWTDPRTGERTLRHRMPLNWKDYLPPTAAADHVVEEEEGK
jgi:ribosomal protein L32